MIVVQNKSDLMAPSPCNIIVNCTSYRYGLRIGLDTVRIYHNNSTQWTMM